MNDEKIIIIIILLIIFFLFIINYDNSNYNKRPSLSCLIQNKYHKNNKINNFMNIYDNSVYEEINNINCALFIVGQARYFEKGYHTIKKFIIDQYNPDIFIHTWSYKENKTNAAPWNNLGDIIITQEHLENYINLYNPMYYEIENSLDSDSLPIRKSYEKTSHANTRYNFYSYLYSLNKCYELSEKSYKKYDFYIIVRSDVLIFNFPKKNTWDINKFMIWNRYTPDVGGLLDTMICTVPRKYIKDYCNFYKRVDEYYDKGYKFNYEELTYAHFMENNFYKDSLIFDRNNFEWGYFRNERIERM
jgi:hypothetical protein